MKVIVVGAGVIGCAVAYELSTRGAETVLIDMRRPGDGATAASGGILAPYIEGHSQALLRLGTASLSMFDAFVERVRRDSGRHIEYTRTGTLEVALTDDQHARLLETMERYRGSGLECRYLDAGALLALEPAIAATAVGGVHVPAHGLVGARDLTAALATAAQRNGATVVHETRVERIAPTGTSVGVIGPTGTQEADAVVLTAGSWSGQVPIGRTPPVPVKPIRGQLLHLAFGRPPARHVLWGRECYLVPWGDGSVLVGATVEDVGFDERATVAGVRDLLDAACELVPSAWTARFQAVRVGLRPATSDELPIIGRAAVSANIVYATGHYRNGVLLTPLTATAVADLVLEGREIPELALTRPARFGL